MRNWVSVGGRIALVVLALVSGISGVAPGAESLDAVSLRDSAQTPSAGGGGDSWNPLMTPDGRFVLFTSTANNLVLAGTNQPVPLRSPSKLNVFLRDRANHATVLVSTNINGTGGGDGDSYPLALSTNGVYALFQSSAGDLVPGDTNGVSDIFLRNLVTGTTLLVSVSTNGAAGNGESRDADMTADGRFVTFVSGARDLVPNDNNNIADVFVRDMQTGSTIMASVGAHAVKGAFNGTNSSENPKITPDGRYVVFSSSASNLVAGVTSIADIYVRDLTGGTTYWASSGARSALQAAQNSASGICYDPVISADGQYVAYQISKSSFISLTVAGIVLRYSVASGLSDVLNTNAPVTDIAYTDIDQISISADGRKVAFVAYTNGVANANCVYVWDAQLGGALLASGDLSNAVPPVSGCFYPTLDPQGRWVTFLSSAPGLVTNSVTGDFHLYRREFQSNTTSLLDRDANGVGLPLSSLVIPVLSADGRFVAFDCQDAGAVPDDRNHESDVFVRDLVYGTNELISIRAASLPSLSPNGYTSISPFSLSTGAGRIVFTSDADDLTVNDTNACRDVYVRDVIAGTNILVSVNTNGFSGNNVSFEGAISPNGRYVAFTSVASDLVAGDTNKAKDVFIRDLQTGVTALVSANSAGTGPGNNDSSTPLMCGNGGFVVFRSKATDLTAGSFSRESLFLRDLQAGTNYALTSGALSVQSVAVTPDGRYVAYGVTNGVLKIWDTQAGHDVYTNSPNLLAGGIAITADGARVAYNANGSLYVADRLLETNFLVAATSVVANQGLHFSADGGRLTYTLSVRTNGSSWTNQVYVYHFPGGTNQLVSRAFDGSGAGNRSSDWPDISADGRFVAYRSFAQNLVPGDTNNFPDIFLCDLPTGTTTLLSVNAPGNAPGNHWSILPVFSGDGATLIFESWASDLTTGNFNQSQNVVAYKLFASGGIPLFAAEIMPRTGPGQAAAITWPVIPGKSYRLQFKNDVDDPDWHEAGGGVTILGSQGYFNDLAPTAGPRFYRVVAN